MDKGKLPKGGSNKGKRQIRGGTVKKRTYRLQPDGLPDAGVGGVEDSTGPSGRVDALLSHRMVGKLCSTTKQEALVRLE